MAAVIEADNISKKFRYRKKDFYAVKNASFTVDAGEIFGLLGPNGAGKSTLLNLIVGILVPDSGSISVFGKSTQKNREILEEISMVSGETHFHWGMRTKDVLTFYGMLYGLDRKERDRRISRLVNFFGLDRVLYSKVGYLSTGERMRLVFAKALLNYPKLLLLDEPTLGLDPDIAIRVREEILRINKKFRTTILLTSHYMQEVEQLADRIAFINKGIVVDIGTIEKIKLRHFSTYDVTIKVKKIKDAAYLRRAGFRVSGTTLRKTIGIDQNISEILSSLVRRNFEVIDIESRKPTLEDYFVKILGDRK